MLSVLSRLVAAVVILFGVAQRASAQTFTTINDPLGTEGTVAQGIQGSNIVGSYQDSSGNTHGFLYNSGTFTTISDPLNTGSQEANGIYGNEIVGDFYNGASNGYLYNGSTFQTISDPLGTRTYAFGVYGTNVVGYYQTNSGQTNGFVYNGTTYTTLSDPSATFGTYARGIFGNTIVGFYTGNAGAVGFSYSNGIYTDLPSPGFGENVDGISGNQLAGSYQIAGGEAAFFYDGAAFTTLEDPSTTNNQTYGMGLSGSSVVGYYVTSTYTENGFVVTVPAAVPEPASVVLFSVMGIGLLGRRGRRFTSRR